MVFWQRETGAEKVALAPILRVLASLILCVFTVFNKMGYCQCWLSNSNIRHFKV